MDKNTGRKKSKKKMLAKTKFCESLRVRNYERPTAYYYFDIWLMFLLSWKYSKQCDIGITCNSKGVLVIFLKLNSSDWMILRRYHSLNLKWFIRSIYLRPFLQNVYKEKPWCTASGLFLCLESNRLMKHLLIGPTLYTFKGLTSLSIKLGILLNA